MLTPVVRLLRWIRKRLTVAVTRSSGARRASLELGGAVLLVGAITTIAMLGVHPLLPVGGGIGLSVLFVVAHSWIVAQEQCSA